MTHNASSAASSPASPGAEPWLAGPALDGAHLYLDDPPGADDTPGSTAGLAVLLHGAGSGTRTPVLTALADRLRSGIPTAGIPTAGGPSAGGVLVARLEMPYRVAGKRPPDRPAKLDGVLRAAVAALRAAYPDRPLVLAGASMGSRVACRCAREVGAAGVLALGFPLLPPGGRPSRAPELAGAGVGVLVVQGARDVFGRPAADPGVDRAVHVVAGADHSFKVRTSDGRDPAGVVAEAAEVGAAWLLTRLGGESVPVAGGCQRCTHPTEVP